MTRLALDFFVLPFALLLGPEIASIPLDTINTLDFAEESYGIFQHAHDPRTLPPIFIMRIGNLLSVVRTSNIIRIRRNGVDLCNHVIPIQAKKRIATRKTDHPQILLHCALDTTRSLAVAKRIRVSQRERESRGQVTQTARCASSFIRGMRLIL